MGKAKKYEEVTEASLVSGYRWICVHPDYLGGRPAIFPKRFPVAMVLEDLSKGWLFDDFEREYGIPREAILEALRYASEHLVSPDVATGSHTSP